MSEPPRLAPGYTAEFDGVSETEWYSLLQGFDDANLYQTWACAAEIGGRRAVHPFVLRQNGEVAAIALVRAKTVPLVGVGFASVYWGPLWRRKDHIAEPEIFRQAIRALRAEFIHRRGITLRVFPFALQNDLYRLPTLLAEEGFRAVGGRTEKRKIVMDLRPSLDALREGMSAHARRNLRKAQRNNLEWIEAADPESFHSFGRMYQHTLARKGVVDAAPLEQLRRAQQRLPDSMKLKLLLCRDAGIPCAGAIFSCLGETSVFVCSATSERGANNWSSYLLHWRAIEESKLRGAQTYDLDGVDPEGNPGSYRFKQGIAGIHGSELQTMGRFDAVPDSINYHAVRLIEGFNLASIWAR